MAKAHAPGGLRDPLWFILLKRQWSGSADRAKTASAGATIPCDHEGRGALAPTLEMVGALCAFANSVEIQFVKESARVFEAVRGGQFDTQPFGQPGAGWDFKCRHKFNFFGTELFTQNQPLSKFCFQKRSNSSGPKSARTFPSTWITGAISCPEI